MQDAVGNGLDENASSEIQRIFGRNNADKIESYFEKSGQSFEEDEDIELWNSKHMWPGDTERLILILKNVIKNRGIFKP